MANQMISAFTPSLMSPQELETILVQRQDLAQELFEKIVLSATTPAKHYALLIGMRGMGKTHLVALIYYRLLAEFVKTPTLKDKLVIAWLREEEWGVDSWLDLVSRILRALAVEEPQSKLLLEELRRISIEDSIDRAAANATRLLKEAIGNRTLLLIMENLDDLFKGLGEAGQQQFRSFLQAEQCCTILATTPALFTAVQSRTKPFFGFFNPIHLDRLTVPEAIEMLGKIATLGGQEDLASFLQTPLGRARVRAVHHLEGGNPRVYMLFSQFITRDALDNLVEAFMKMLDDLTPYYQARMKELSNQQRKIVELLVDRRHPVMVKEIAADCFIDPGTAASQLRELRKLGYVEAEQNGRESFYELREVLMRLCLEVKKQRGQWVEIFVEFLKIWYPLSERKNQLELMRGTSQYINDEHLERALLSDEDPCFIVSQRDLQRALKEQQQLLATETLEELFHSKRLTEENYQKLVELVQTERYSEAQKLFSEIASQEDRSVEKSKLTISLQFSEGLDLLAAEENLEALELFDAVLAEDKSDVNAWHNRGVSLHNLGRYKEAIASYDRAISIKPDDHETWHNRSISLRKLGRYEEAIASYDRAISIKPDKHEAWHNKGIAYFKWGKYVESIDCYNQAIAIKPDRYDSLHNKGVVQFVIDNYENALNSWQQTFKIIQQLTPHPNDIAGLIQEFLEQLIPRLSLLINPLLPSEAKVSIPPPIGISPLPSLNPSTPPSTNSSPPPSFNPSILPPTTPSIPPSTTPSMPPSIDFSPTPFIYSSTFLTQLVTIYREAQVLPELSTALIATLPQILAPNISDRTADEWLALWQNRLGTEPSLEMPLRLMNVAIAYKKQPAQQKRLWLGLAKEERSILNGALGLEEF
jgi:tetratricopeptide (TPR) repeat protein